MDPAPLPDTEWFDMSRFAAILFAIFLVPAANAADRPAPEVKRQLEAAGTPYQVDDDNDFKVTVDLGNGRTQLVYILSDTNAVGTLRVRELWSAGYKAEDGRMIPLAVANRLLEHSNSVILGSWVKQKGGFAVFVIKIPHDATGAQLDTAIDQVAKTADEIEREFSGTEDTY